MSYFQMLGMQKEPFSTSPDPNFFYESREHMAALMRIMIEIRLKRGLSVIMGNVGIGKTTLCRKLLQMFNAREDVEAYIILDPAYSSEKLALDDLVRTFGIDTSGLTRKPSVLDLKHMLKDFLFTKGIERNKTVVLLIDESQKMTSRTLEILRTFLNYETNEFKLLQLVLVGQLEFFPHIRKMKNFADRVSLQYILNPLDAHEVKEMIDFRLQKAGCAEGIKLFEDEAVENIYNYTHGYPRRVSILCHKALIEMVLDNRSRVDRDLIQQIISKEIFVTTDISKEILVTNDAEGI